MKFGYTILYVESVEETIAFYKNAFGFKLKFITPEKDYAELVTGETTLAFGLVSLADANFKKGYQKSNPTHKPFGVELAFISNNIEKDFAQCIAAGAQEYEPINTKPWGQKVGYVRDNNGFLIEICTPIMAG